MMWLLGTVVMMVGMPGALRPFARRCPSVGSFQPVSMTRGKMSDEGLAAASLTPGNDANPVQATA
ncbi:hypothetical protein HaLaN_20570 [Haematococcus lacustris]|uniref:Uncharacterized protein n=1 Tax=Haematococcus lacustris TaxID=44745 RepID=A0A6A0A1Q6_HAELA|nr:hypothetical protein HaLaN_20570 [Haematococcus lacustris]